MSIRFGREVCGDTSCAGQREWIVTNGLGGFASGTISGVLTRRYHGLLIASEQPPVVRKLLCPKFDETAYYCGLEFPLFSNRWIGGTVTPLGNSFIQSFSVHRAQPEWIYALRDAVLRKTIRMVPGSNTTIVHYELMRASAPLRIVIQSFANYRDYHHLNQAGITDFNVTPSKRGVLIAPSLPIDPFFIWATSGSVTPDKTWYYGFELLEEQRRGLDSVEDHLHVATVDVELHERQSVSLVVSDEYDDSFDLHDAFQACSVHEAEIFSLSQKSIRTKTRMRPEWIQELIFAADQFIVERQQDGQHIGYTVIAGYPWFSDWGRDALLSLPGLALLTGRPRIARSILTTFAEYLSEGLLPNRFPDAGSTPEYNSVDAPLMFIDALREYILFTKDDKFLKQMFATVEEIIHRYDIGTQFNISRDADDGLIYAGTDGTQLTWMDAKVGGWVVTPRLGKPVEINALWYSALCSARDWAKQLGKNTSHLKKLAIAAKKGFARYWNPEANCCFDVIDGPEGNDSAIRPNQLFAVSLPYSALSLAQGKSVVTVCTQHLLTSCGIRSLTPRHSSYRPRYEGDQVERDASYHQGTVWGWLIGPFIVAHLRVFKDPKAAARILEPFEDALRGYGVGTLGEIFDGDPPHKPRGCIAQAWTVAQVLRAWHAIESFPER